MNPCDRVVVCSLGPCPSEQPEPKEGGAESESPVAFMPSPPRHNLPKLLASGRHRLQTSLSPSSTLFTCDKIERPSCLGCNMGTQFLLR
jgi:hypothetical protein